MRIAAVLAWAILAVLLGVADARADGRAALVIGNASYRNVAALPNPVNDAADVAGALRGLGFDVTELTNASFDQMRRGIIAFGRQARGADMAVVYFAGHGMELGGQNWLIPIDAELRTDIDAEAEAVSLRFVMEQVAGAKRLGLVILDACRNNPFAARMQRTSATRAVERGLSRVEPTGDNVAVVYAAKDGTTADDGRGRNSPFTTALLRHLATPGLDVRFLFASVRDDVMAATHGQQQPFIYQSLPRAEIFLRPPAAAASAAMPATAPAPSDLAERTWAAIANTTSQAILEDFIRQFGGTPYGLMARARLEELKSKETAVAAPSAPPPTSAPAGSQSSGGWFGGLTALLSRPDKTPAVPATAPAPSAAPAPPPDEIAIAEGLTSEQIVKRLLEADSLGGNIREIPREGALAPERYQVARGTPREQVIERMREAQRRLVQEIWDHRNPDLPLKSPEELVTLASLIEKETSKAEERTRIAAVLVNRLKLHMKLQSDASVVYGVVGGKGTLGHPITSSELHQATPYNTYIIDGLPPGPIANPGRAALQAAANPARTKELYFAADGAGGHVFSESFEQHQKNVVNLRASASRPRGDGNAPAATPPPGRPTR